MPLLLTSAPAAEPITLADAKSHLRVDTTADDVLISALITTSRLQIEAALDMALIHQTWSLLLDVWPMTPHITLPFAPVSHLVAVRTYDDDDIATPIPLATFQLDNASSSPRLLRRDGFTQTSRLRRLNAIEIAFVAGFGAAPDSVPAPIRQALRLLVAHWYEHRDPGEVDVPAANVPASVSSLLAPYRRVRLH
jgi:uncharacterized phiE125 gp8 family phage protein